jgi:hypothetical protein
VKKTKVYVGHRQDGMTVRQMVRDATRRHGMSNPELRKAVEEWLEAGRLRNTRPGYTEHPLNPDLRQETLGVALMLRLADSFGLQPRPKDKKSEYTGWYTNTLWIKFEKAEMPLPKDFPGRKKP